MRTPNQVTLQIDFAEILRASEEAINHRRSRGNDSSEEEAFAREVRSFVLKALKEAVEGKEDTATSF